MFLWFMTLFFTLLIPCTMLLFGVLWKRRPPRDINCLYGYRTARSCKSQAAWDFAHQYIGRVWRGWGLGSLVASAVGFVVGSLALAGWDPAALGTEEMVDPFSWLCLILVGLQMGILVGSIFPAERALKRRFDQEGKPRKEEEL